MTTRRTFVLSKSLGCSASFLALSLVAITWTVSGEQVKPPPERDARRLGSFAPEPAARQRFLAMFARAYFPGRTGQLLIVPREGDFITRNDPNVEYMHGSPWSYDISIPLMFVGPAVIRGAYPVPAAQQDVAPTLAASLGVQMPRTATGRILPVLRNGFARPRVVMLVVLDGMRRDYFDRYAASMPTLTALRQQSAWFTQARVNVLPSNTALGHSTIATGADPRVSVRLYPERVVIVADHDIIAEHPRGVDRDHVSYTWQHYLPLVERKPGALRNGAPFAELPEPLQRLRRALLRHEGGDKVMARVLMAVPTHGLDAVLVAVELVLESGRPSAEHVLNVLARLTDAPAPASVTTALTVATAPLADPHRYDTLRDEEAFHG
jgi:hypothetical protein